jgi:hypothetical protein
MAAVRLRCRRIGCVIGRAQEGESSAETRRDVRDGRTRCTHRVRPVVGDRDRVCVIFAYDAPGKNFSRDLTADYYVYK